MKFEVTKEMSADASAADLAGCRPACGCRPSARQLPAGVLEKAANTCPVHQSLAPSVEKVIELHLGVTAAPGPAGPWSS